MEITDIRPIPKRILALIKKADAKQCYYTPGTTRYYAYFAVWKKELVYVTVAVKEHRRVWYCKQVAVHTLQSKRCFLRDIILYYIGGYQVGWFDLGLYKYPKYYEDGEWGEFHRWDLFQVPAVIVDKQAIGKFPAYQYSAYKEYQRCDILRYLAKYERYPQAEYLVKMGLSEHTKSTQILRLVGKDKAFRAWLVRNREALSKYPYYISTILSAYKKHTPLDVMERLIAMKIELRKSEYRNTYQLFQEKPERIFAYIEEKGISLRLYEDYIAACIGLELDMTQNKNLIPHDFTYWHDTRIAEWRKKKDLADAERRKEFYEKFRMVSDKYHSLADKETPLFLCRIPTSPADLRNEGTALHHCVGISSYDVKFSSEVSLIFFIRKADAPDTPYVTIEFSLSKKCILQCYGNGNTRPDAETLAFVEKTWLPYAKKQLKKIAA